MAVGETPSQGCQNGSKNSLEFCHVNTLKCLRFVWKKVSDCKKNKKTKQTGPPDAKTNLRKSHFIMCHVTKYPTIIRVFQQPWPRVSPTAILDEEKALGTRLVSFTIVCARCSNFRFCRQNSHVCASGLLVRKLTRFVDSQWTTKATQWY